VTFVLQTKPARQLKPNVEIWRKKRLLLEKWEGFGVVEVAFPRMGALAGVARKAERDGGGILSSRPDLSS
jgi:hypothetical protein